MLALFLLFAFLFFFFCCYLFCRVRHNNRLYLLPDHRQTTPRPLGSVVLTRPVRLDRAKATRVNQQILCCGKLRIVFNQVKEYESVCMHVGFFFFLFDVTMVTLDAASRCDWVKLNVGGKVFATTRYPVYTFYACILHACTPTCTLYGGLYSQNTELPYPLTVVRC